MGWLGAIASLALGATSGIIGAVQQRRQVKAQQDALNQQAAAEQQALQQQAAAQNKAAVDAAAAQAMQMKQQEATRAEMMGLISAQQKFHDQLRATYEQKAQADRVKAEINAQEAKKPLEAKKPALGIFFDQGTTYTSPLGDKSKPNLSRARLFGG